MGIIWKYASWSVRDTEISDLTCPLLFGWTPEHWATPEGFYLRLLFQPVKSPILPFTNEVVSCQKLGFQQHCQVRLPKVALCCLLVFFASSCFFKTSSYPQNVLRKLRKNHEPSDLLLFKSQSSVESKTHVFFRPETWTSHGLGSAPARSTTTAPGRCHKLSPAEAADGSRWIPQIKGIW